MGALPKDKMKQFLLKSLKLGIFNDFFERKEAELNANVEQFFDSYFKSLFEESDSKDTVDKFFLTAHIAEKFADDDNFQEMLTVELEKMESPEQGAITAQMLKYTLRAIMKQHIKAINEQREEQEDIIEELQQTEGGGYARQMIQRTIESYKESGINGDPLTDVKDLLDLFYNDELVNN